MKRISYRSKEGERPDKINGTMQTETCKESILTPIFFVRLVLNTTVFEPRTFPIQGRSESVKQLQKVIRAKVSELFFENFRAPFVCAASRVKNRKEEYFKIQNNPPDRSAPNDDSPLEDRPFPFPIVS